FTLPPAVTRSLPSTRTFCGFGRRTAGAFGDCLTTLTTRGARPFAARPSSGCAALARAASRALGTPRRPRCGAASACSGFQITSSLPMC
ncbi:hypothetical protein BMAJHU_C0289, partial [Burkholderia mallei JHU]